jgi:hypothetical protein
MKVSQDADNHMWPRREPLGSMTGIGIDERRIPGAGLYSYPDNLYSAARSRRVAVA